MTTKETHFSENCLKMVKAELRIPCRQQRNFVHWAKKSSVSGCCHRRIGRFSIESLMKMQMRVE